MATEKVIIAELDIDTGDVIKNQEELGKEILATTKQLQAARKENQQYTAENIKAAANLKTLKTQYNANQRVLQGLSATQTGQVKTVLEARKVVAALNVEWQKSANINGENDERTKQLADKITFLNKQINENKLAVGDSTSNIGKYNNQLGESVKSAGGFGGAMGAIKTSIMGATKAALAFVATPLGVMLAAVAGIIKVLSSAFKRSEDRMNKVRASTGKLSGVFNGLMKILEPVVDFIVNTVIKAFDGLGKIVDKTVGFVGKVLGKLGFDKAAEKVENFQKKMNDAAEAGERLARAEIALEKALRVAQKTQLDFQKLAEKQRQIRDDESKAIDERIKANKELGRLLQLQLNTELEIANKALAVANLRIQVEGETTAALNERAEALTNISDIEERITGQFSEQMVNTNSLIKERKELEKERSEAFQKDIDAELEAELAKIEQVLEAETEAANKSIETLNAKIEAEREALDNKRQAELMDRENDLLLMEDHLNKEFELRQFDLDRQREQEIAAAKETGADVQKIKEKFAKAEDDLEKQKTHAKLSLAQDFAGNIKTIFGENTKVGKAAAIAETTINTYKSAQAAYSSLAGIPIVGPVLGAAAAGAAVAAGFKNIQKIKAINPSGGGGAGGGGSAAVASPQSSGANIPTPTAGAVGSTNFSSAIITSGTQQQGAQQQAAQQGLETALANSPNVLVLEDFEATAGRKVEVVNESEQ